MNVLRHCSPRLKKKLALYDANNYKSGMNYSCAASIFNETHTFRSEHSFLIYAEKRKEEKKLNSNNILATQNSMNQKSAR